MNEWLYYPRDSPSAGFLNVPEILRRHPNVAMICIVGARQTGKTYGAIDTLYKRKTPFIYMRLTEEEREQALSGKADLFRAKSFPWADDMKIEDGKICYCYADSYADGKQPLIMATSLVKLNHMRGYAGDPYTDMLIDEFIPMKQAYKRKGYGQTVADAYTTINGQRERFGKPPLRLWLLANSNDLSADILVYFDLVAPLLRMKKKKQNYAYFPERGLVLINLYDSPASEDLRKSALFKMLGNNWTTYADCAIYNEFSGDDMIGVQSIPLKELTPEFCVDGYNFYTIKGRDGMYIAKSNGTCLPYYDLRNASHKRQAVDELLCHYPVNRPVDGQTIFYGDYSAKVMVYGLLNLT